MIIDRAYSFDEKYTHTVTEIMKNVKTNGDKALFEYTETFDNFKLNKDNIEISRYEIQDSYSQLDADIVAALKIAKDRISDFHNMQYEKSWYTYGVGGAMLGQKIAPINTVGVYIPGGRASYPSSVLMNVIPARIAGVQEIVMVTPTPNGIVNPAVLVAADIAGVDRIFRIGGAQAVAALAYSTKSVPKVDKIVGPGNIYVAIAKKLVYGTVGVDMVAGPSEIAIIADDSANPVWIAADMLSQAEHDPDSYAISIVLTEEMAKSVETELKRQLESIDRKDVAFVSINEHSAVIIAEDITDACEIANLIAPEHLELCVASPLELLGKIKHAGAIFAGHFTPEAAGDYIAGPNHVLPTGGAARFSSPLGVYDFIKRSSILYYTAEALRKDMKYIELLACFEGFTGHAESVRKRK
jgi:histidinol dehydrogenase